ncbi:MAG: ribonuclease H-like domain-containing protein [Planctomycetes bacterium]|nr:ribonuclease H-like domain-containing protein [Planctomycetota bacterium]
MVAPDRDRLRRAFRVPAAPAAAPVPEAAPAPGDLRAFLRARGNLFGAEQAAGPLGPRPVVELPPGAEGGGAAGPFWRREQRVPAEAVHGAVPLAAGLQFDPAQLALLLRAPWGAEVRAEQCLCLDTETTGLSGGAGTVVFAYGLAFVRAGQWVVEQLFLRDFGEERAVLEHLAQRLAEFPVPVTFVGKSFDRHRIHARLLLHKLRAPVLTERHVDLYHLARRAFGGGLPDTRLRTVEQHCLGLLRHDDLPGSEAPAAYLAWLRDRSGPVDRVLEHNRLDVLSLIALLGVLGGAAAPVAVPGLAPPSIRVPGLREPGLRVPAPAGRGPRGRAAGAVAPGRSRARGTDGSGTAGAP